MITVLILGLAAGICALTAACAFYAGHAMMGILAGGCAVWAVLLIKEFIKLRRLERALGLRR